MGNSERGVMNEHTPAVQPDPSRRSLAVTDLAAVFKTKESSVYNLTRRRGRVRYAGCVGSIRGFKLRCSNPRPPQPDSVVGTTKPLFERSRDGSQYQRRSENLKSWISRTLEAGDLMEVAECPCCAWMTI